ncbi:ABC transporter permease subunit [Macrococcus sp. EM39E]|uniref:ABC transporter permease subunit n=2 Tax=Macrococcus animalis TaxID=3395467 RepID=UPI0039BE2FC7
MKNIFNIVITIFMLFLLACIPSLFNEQKIDFSHFIHSLGNALKSLFNPGEIVFENIKSGVRHNLFPFIIEPWINSMTILFSSLLISLLFSLCIAFLMYQSKLFNQVIIRTNRILSIIPDIFYIPVFISVIIFIYIKTNVLLFDVASSHEKDAVIFPIILLLIIPISNSITVIHQLLDAEREESYVSFARSKGLNNKEIFFGHILKNILTGYFINFKQIVWMTLSSLLFLERLLNVFGISVFIFEYNSPIVLFISFLLMYLPIRLLFYIAENYTQKTTGRGLA